MNPGVVSAAVAEGIRLHFGTDLGLATTGLAVPTGGTPGAPVGCVCLGLATPTGTRSRRLELGPDPPRTVIQGRATRHAMNWARLALLGRDR